MSDSLSAFVEKFAATFDESTGACINSTTVFKELKEWDSLQALTIVAMADEDFNLKVGGDDLKRANTIEELFNLISH